MQLLTDTLRPKCGALLIDWKMYCSPSLTFTTSSPLISASTAQPKITTRKRALQDKVRLKKQVGKSSIIAQTTQPWLLGVLTTPFILQCISTGEKQSPTSKSFNGKVIQDGVLSRTLWQDTQSPTSPTHGGAWIIFYLFITSYFMKFCVVKRGLTTLIIITVVMCNELSQTAWWIQGFTLGPLIAMTYGSEIAW